MGRLSYLRPEEDIVEGSVITMVTQVEDMLWKMEALLLFIGISTSRIESMV